MFASCTQCVEDECVCVVSYPVCVHFAVCVVTAAPPGPGWELPSPPGQKGAVYGTWRSRGVWRCGWGGSCCGRPCPWVWTWPSWLWRRPWGAGCLRLEEEVVQPNEIWPHNEILVLLPHSLWRKVLPGSETESCINHALIQVFAKSMHCSTMFPLGPDTLIITQMSEHNNRTTILIPVIVNPILSKLCDYPLNHAPLTPHTRALQ